MTDDNNANLESILSEFETPPLEKTLANMDNQHLQQVAAAVSKEYGKRQDPLADVGKLNDAQFEQLKRLYGV